MNTKCSLADVDSRLSPRQKVILDWLREYGVLTPLEAGVNLGITPIEPIISELRAMGHEIHLETYSRPKGINSPETNVYWLCNCDPILEKFLDTRLKQAGWSPETDDRS